MAQMSFLNGKLLKISLPAFTSAPPPDAPGPKRLFLPQGELAHFYDGPEAIQYIAFMELREGSVRGNHWHYLKKEYLYVIAGELLLVAREVELASGPDVSVKLQVGDLAVIAAGIAHALKTIVPGHAVEFAPTKFNATDIQRLAPV